MPTKKQTPRKTPQVERSFESDGQYLLKLVVFAIIGTIWIRFAHPMSWGGVPLGGVPVGLLAGAFLVSRYEKHQSDRKIWYAILVIVTIVSNFYPTGLVI